MQNYCFGGSFLLLSFLLFFPNQEKKADTFYMKNSFLTILCKTLSARLKLYQITAMPFGDYPFLNPPRFHVKSLRLTSRSVPDIDPTIFATSIYERDKQAPQE